ncbi:hypothetical protein NQ315_011709 [Exocentrus adspersus]|uniref:Uncharacterized protein n=1 Tax=Exocentrus adspersus TaxID=1586481 RepID=A0AAV8W0Y7_9CUCU|nr:hypothetical protein NQ315_011709 [Exocentrus adspersus]
MIHALRSKLKNYVPPTRKLEMLLEFVASFFERSSIHGLPHIMAGHRPLETFIWSALVASAVYGAAVLSSVTLARYRDNPTVISMERDRFSWNTSFPAATVCPTDKINMASLDAYLENAEVKDKSGFREFLVSLSRAEYGNFESVVPYEEVKAEEYMGLLKKFQFRFRPTVTNSGLNGEQLSLMETVTEMGICYSFNSHLAAYNSFEYWKKGSWNLLPQNETFSLNPLDGEVFANVVNISSGFQVQGT